VEGYGTFSISALVFLPGTSSKLFAVLEPWQVMTTFAEPRGRPAVGLWDGKQGSSHNNCSDGPAVTLVVVSSSLIPRHFSPRERAQVRG